MNSYECTIGKLINKPRTIEAEYAPESGRVIVWTIEVDSELAASIWLTPDDALALAADLINLAETVGTNA